MREEKDSLGKVTLPENAMYGIQTERAKENFNLCHKNVNPDLVKAIIKVKKAAALSYREVLSEKAEIYDFINEACDKVLSDYPENDFILEALQGGAGTSTNMNVNEVIANTALTLMGEKPGSHSIIHPLDDVNRGQSTNDVYPTALRIASIDLLRSLSEECAKLQESLQKKENSFDHIKKLGRTELMDAVPVTLGNEFGCYAQAIARDRWRLYKVEERLRQVNIGGTAVGRSDNTLRAYRYKVIEHLRNITGMGLAMAEYPMDITQNNDVFVEVSGLIKALAVNLMKISNDFRLMASGPYGGIGEIRLKHLQMGSTIMPGKVNPVIPEMVIQTAIKVISNDTAVSMACAHGEFELNAFMPLIADSILESLQLMNRAVYIFRTKCVDHIEADEERCRDLLDKSYSFATEYTQILGYEAVAEVINKHQGNPKKIKEELETFKKA